MVSHHAEIRNARRFVASLIMLVADVYDKDRAAGTRASRGNAPCAILSPYRGESIRRSFLVMLSNVPSVSISQCLHFLPRSPTDGRKVGQPPATFRSHEHVHVRCFNADFSPASWYHERDLFYRSLMDFSAAAVSCKPSTVLFRSMMNTFLFCEI